MTFLLTLAGIAIAVFGWEACWRLGDIRDDQELRESGIVLGPALAFVAVLGVSLLSPPTSVAGPAPARDILLAVGKASVHVLLLSASVVGVLEYIAVDSGRIETHEGLLFAPFRGEES